jgi:hypothetical protein
MLKLTGHGMLKSTQFANQWEGRPSAALPHGGGGVDFNMPWPVGFN